MGATTISRDTIAIGQYRRSLARLVLRSLQKERLTSPNRYAKVSDGNIVHAIQFGGVSVINYVSMNTFGVINSDSAGVPVGDASVRG